MDVNCGTVLDGAHTVEQAEEAIFDLILRIAGDERTESEAYDYGGAEFGPWQLGITV